MHRTINSPSRPSFDQAFIHSLSILLHSFSLSFFCRSSSHTEREADQQEDLLLGYKSGITKFSLHPSVCLAGSKRGGRRERKRETRRSVTASTTQATPPQHQRQKRRQEPRNFRSLVSWSSVSASHRPATPDQLSISPSSSL